MAKLSKVSYYTKKIIKFAIIGILVFLIATWGYRVLKELWLKYNPPPPLPPTVSFGKLPQIEFPLQESMPGQEYLLETPTGALPELADQTKVFAFIEKKPSLLAAEKANEKALSLGFSGEPNILSPDIYRWSKTSPPGSFLEINILTSNLKFGYNWQADLTVLKNAPAESLAVNESKNFLVSLKQVNQELKNPRIETTYLKLSAGSLNPAPSLSEAQFVRVNVFRADLEEMPVITPDPEKGIINFLISGESGFSKRFAQGEVNFFSLDLENPATYPVKTPQAGWEELKEGKAFISSSKATGTKIVIRRVYLAYLDSPEEQKYLQPIFVFEGDEDFVALLPAITDDWLE